MQRTFLAFRKLKHAMELSAADQGPYSQKVINAPAVGFVSVQKAENEPLEKMCRRYGATSRNVSHVVDMLTSCTV